MKIFLIIALLVFLYLRKPFNKLWRNTRINYLIGLYNSYRQANTHDEKLNAFEQIARNRPLSNDLIGGIHYSSPSYKDFENDEKIRNAYLRLCEVYDSNYYQAKKLLHPKFLIKDIFFLPGLILSFLFNRKFKKTSSFVVSCITWLATILISAYAAELRILIDGIIKRLI